jgi:hypothetical protein
MIVLNTVSTDKVITGSGMNKKSIKRDVNKTEMTMGCGIHSATTKMAGLRVNLGEKRKPIKFL